MPATLATFEEWIQEPLDAGAISPAQAWALEWEILVLQGQPWTPGVREVLHLVDLFHKSPEELMRGGLMQ